VMWMSALPTLETIPGEDSKVQVRPLISRLMSHWLYIVLEESSFSPVVQNQQCLQIIRRN
jgi:hypothetical protein